MSVFTTTEGAELGGAIMVKGADGELQSLSRDRLFISLHQSCKHRPTAITDATALTQIIISQIAGQQVDGVVTTQEIIALTHLALGRFDHATAAVYAAYHPVASG